MTPQEQIEDAAKCEVTDRDGNVWLIVEKSKLRAIRFDSPQISEGMVEAGAVAMMGLSYQRWDSLDEMAKNISRIKSRACLSAALTQKGEA